MKRAIKASSTLSFWLLALLLLGLSLGTWLWLAVAHSGQSSRHLVQAELLVVPGGTFAALPQQLTDAPAGPWQTVTLPHTWPQPLTRTAGNGLRATWLRVDLQALPPMHGPLALYLPRWQSTGRIAIYADDKLLYRSTGDAVWNGFNYPLWISLDGEGTAERPRVLRVRIDSPANAGGAISSLWVGAAEDLLPRYRIRRMLQTGVAEALGMAFVGLGVFSFAVWLKRREATYLLFAVFTLLWVLRSQRFHVGLEPLPLPSAWFGWMTINAGNALPLIWWLFVATLVPTAPRWPVRALLGFLVVSSLITLPLFAGHSWTTSFAPLPYLFTILAGVPANILMAWYAWRHGGREGLVAAAVGLLHAPVAGHDWMLQSYLLSPEDIYAWPFSTSARMGMFLYVILSRYVGAVETAEQANVHLAERLREREAELVKSHEQLRSVQQRQLISQERQRLMQDIHDGMGSQLMSALKVAESGKLSDVQMAQVLRECIDDLKLTVDSMESVEPDLLLLLATLRYRLAPRIEGSGLRLNWEVQDVPALEWLDARSALHILRILQEGISNVLQHANASSLRVATGARDEGVFVVLEDNGESNTGAHLAPDSSTQAFTESGHGLSNMAKRAQAIDGKVSWERADSGTRFTLWLPLQRPAAKTRGA